MRIVRHSPTSLPVTLAVLLALLAGCDGDQETLRELRDQQREILAKLTALEQKLDRGGARAAGPPRASGPNASRTYALPVEASPIKGLADAPVTIVEFSDFQCPFCARSEALVAQALQAYPTQARVVFKHFPLVSIHPQAMPAALAAVAAQRQGKFWEMHEVLFANQRALAPEQIEEYARRIGLDLQRFKADIASDEVKAQVQADIDLARRSGVRGTPTIFVNGKLLQNRTLDGFKELIEPQLTAARSTTPAATADR